jgi:hypothetical protein
VQETFARYVKDYYIGTFGASVASYDQEYLKNTTPPPAESGYGGTKFAVKLHISKWLQKMIVSVLQRLTQGY